jgi:hypothetical protein
MKEYIWSGNGVNRRICQVVSVSDTIFLCGEVYSLLMLLKMRKDTKFA